MLMNKEDIIKIIEYFDIENIIDNYLIEKKAVNKDWFYKYKLIPYLKKHFKYHVNCGNGF